ncbi:hypothetical protein [Zoogloea sp.]|uniref:hypothetical protein n=1 Tax=Zoogloea sp. TaxID=49181 RepID=UPI00263345B0|nr:hypothetical protein [Zoogloea sp.]MDD3354277.1 hypothetical protein [Zoogloea sp.]
MSVAAPSPPDRTSAALDWLSTEPSGDADLELASLVRFVDELHRPEDGGRSLQQCLELLHRRSLAISGLFRLRLAEATLPLSIGLHRAATRLQEVLGRVASAHGDAITETQFKAGQSLTRNPGTLATRALELLGEQLTISHLAGNSAPFEFWSRAHSTFINSQISGTIDSQPAYPPEGALKAYKYMMAMATCQPEGLTGREILWLGQFLERFCDMTSLSPAAPQDENELGWFWIDSDQDTPPISVNRRPPPHVDGLIYFSAAELARQATRWIETLEEQLPPPEPLTAPLGLPEAATLLRRVREYWATPPQREHSRRRNQYTVKVCCGLDDIWLMLREQDSEARNTLCTEWLVVNESPTGYAIMQVTGSASALSAGMALALRRSEHEPWTLCVVRWIRTETPEQIELGLQVIANSAKPVMVGFRSTTQTRPMRPALVLPPIQALGRQQSILAPAGTYSARRFMLVSDSNRLYIAQGRLLSLDMQTSAVELFQYEIDPYPR